MVPDNNGKMTKRDNFISLKILVANSPAEPEVKARLEAFIDREIELIGQRAEKQKKYQKKHDAAHDALSDSIYSLLKDSVKPMALRDIASKIQDATPQKVTYRLSKMYDEGLITKETKSIDTENGKRRATVYCINNAVYTTFAD